MISAQASQKLPARVLVAAGRESSPHGTLVAVVVRQFGPNRFNRFILSIDRVTGAADRA
jgi:hypothetical protein